jgi:hypothetical protein
VFLQLATVFSFECVKKGGGTIFLIKLSQSFALDGRDSTGLIFFSLYNTRQKASGGHFDLLYVHVIVKTGANKWAH